MKNGSRRYSRRVFLKSTTAGIAAAAARTSDMRIEDISFSFEDIRYRAPYKFGESRWTGRRS